MAEAGRRLDSMTSELSRGCNLGYEEHDGFRYCFTHFGFRHPGSGVSWCDRAPRPVQNDDLSVLDRAGIHGKDAETSLRSLYEKLIAIGKRLADFNGWAPDRLLNLFGPDAGRAAIVLTRTTDG